MNAKEIIEELRCLSENDECVFTAEALAEAADLIESLQAQLLQKTQQLEASKRRERAAVEDIYHMGGCPNCIYNKGRHPDTGLPMCAILKEFPDGQCFKWRGDAEEGDAK